MANGSDSQDKYGSYKSKFINKQAIRGMFEERAPDGDKDKNWSGKNYGHTHAFVTPSGHVFEMDDTKGSERINIYHMSGSGAEILRDGALHFKVVGHAYAYYKGGLTETVDYGNYDFLVNNNYRQTVGKSYHSDVGGSRSLTSGGSTSIYAGGTITVGSEKHMAIKGETICVGTSHKDVRITIKEDGIYIQADKKLTFEADDVAFKCKSFYVAAEQDIKLGHAMDIYMTKDLEVAKHTHIHPSTTEEGGPTSADTGPQRIRRIERTEYGECLGKYQSLKQGEKY